MTVRLDSPLELPCGVRIPNRIAKAAMTEGLATPAGRPTPALDRLYGLWAEGGAGLLITGNVIIDPDHLERPGNVVVAGTPDAGTAAALARWAAAGTARGNQLWAQLSHAGRQTPKIVNPHPKAPSAVPLALPGGRFGIPEPLTRAEIAELVTRFAAAAAALKAAGFTGVQIHAAHGYLIAEFLSPLTNRRSDAYGGDLKGRARFLMEVVEAVRAAVGPDFPVSVKLNSADFQRGGFAFTDSLTVAGWLEKAGVDLIEVSGGTYEQPRMLRIAGLAAEERPAVPASTAAREAYFIDFAQAMREKLTIPLMVTGGFRHRAAMREALATGAVDLIGIARPFCVMPDAAARLLAGLDALPCPEEHLRPLPRPLAFLTRLPAVRALTGFATIYWFYEQLWQLGHKGRPEPGLSPLVASLRVERRHKAIMKARAGARASG